MSVSQPPGPLLSSSWNRLASLLGLTEASHGASAVAQASFGTVVGVAVLLAPVIAVVDPSPLIIIATVGGILASGSGAWVWRSGHHGLATFLGASGLLVAALLSLVGTASVGGATGILLLAAVITAGGLQGRRAAVVASLAAMCAVLIGIAAGPTLRAALDIPSGGVPADEGILLVFVLASIPCWGAYVVAIDSSNREAWQRTVAAHDALSAAHEDVLARSAALERARDEQHVVNELTLMACGSAPLEEVIRACEEAKAARAEGTPAFVQAVEQIVQARTIRHNLTRERAEMAGRLQRQVRVDALERLCAGIAHDFNNLLAVVMASADDLSGDPSLSDAARSTATNITRTVKHATRVTWTLGQYARGLPIGRSGCDASRALAQLEPVLAATVGRAGTFTLDLEPGLTVRLSDEDLERMAISLVANAARAVSEVDDGQIGVTLRRRADRVELVVGDNGPGMDAATRERASEPYFSTGSGPGLGLSMVQGVATGCGGTLRIESEAGRGTTATVSLPADVPQEAPRPDAGAGPRTVLLVDDEPMVRDSITLLLESTGLDVTAVGDAPAALAALGQAQPDLLVCDIQLGNENGYELVQQARSRGLDCPVIYVTGFAGSDNDDPSPSTLVLYKPFRLVDLQTSIDRLFGNLSARPGVG